MTDRLFHQDDDIGKPVEPVKCRYCRDAEFTGRDRNHQKELLRRHMEKKHQHVLA